MCRRIATQELTVITKAKDLCGYVFTVTENSPKRFRFTLSGRMQNLALEIISLLNLANEVFVDIKLLSDLDKSIQALNAQTGYGSDDEMFHVQNKLLTLKLTRATTFEARISKRIDLQHEAIARLKELDYLTLMAVENSAVLQKQQVRLAEAIWDVRKRLGAWIKSDRKRYNY